MIFYIGFVFYGDFIKISESFLKIRFELVLLALCLETLSLFIRSLRQKKFLEYIGIKLSILENTKIYFASMSLIATPGGSGTIIKSHFIKKRHDHRISKTVPIVFVERLQDLLAVVTILSFTFLIFFETASFVIVIISSVLITFVYILFRRKNLLSKFQEKIKKINILQRIVPGPELNNSLEVLSRPKPIFIGWLISVISWIIDSLVVVVVFSSFDHDLNFIQVIQFYLTSISYGAISLIPGGIGVTEVSFLGFLTLHGIEVSIASTIVLIVRLSTIWFATILGLVTMKLVLK